MANGPDAHGSLEAEHREPISPQSTTATTPEQDSAVATGRPYHPERDTTEQQPGAHDEPRWSAYAENRPNPLPQFVDPDDHAPQVVEPKGQGELDPLAGVPITRPPGVEPDGAEPRSPAVVFGEPPKSWLNRNKIWVIFLVVLIVLAGVGIAVGVEVATRQSSYRGSQVYVCTLPYRP